MDAAIYVRYSSSRQDETSIDDQIVLCCARIDSEGWRLTSSYSDREVSGSIPVIQRAGGKRLLSDALNGKFKVLLIEGLDRLSRTLVEQETVIRRLEHNGIRIIGMNDSYDSNQKGNLLIRGMRGVFNEIYLEDLKYKTHRGMSGQVARGFAAGAAPFGYRNVRVEGGSLIEINRESAEWVIWIYEEFANGRSAKSIAYELNEKGIRSPRGTSWSYSSLHGSPSKGSGILNNELYRGRYIWNRSQWPKDPDTGKRTRIEVPESEWITCEREDLRIISEDLWCRVRARFQQSSCKGGVKGKGGKARSLLGGLMHCGKCGGPVVVVSSHSYGCSNRMNRGETVCDGVNVNREKIEQEYLSCIQEGLLSDEMLEYAEERVLEVWNEKSKSLGLDQRTLLNRKREIDNRISRYIEAIGAVGISDSLVDKLKAAEFEQAKLQKEIKYEQEKKPTVVLPNLKKRYKSMVSNLQGTLKSDIEKARLCLKELLGEVQIN